MIIRGQRDSLGVPMEPDETEALQIAEDWRGTPIMSDEADSYLEIDGEYILDDYLEITDYLILTGSRRVEVHEIMLERGLI
ncbi:hypothetical protein [Globicatella sanguinis]